MPINVPLVSIRIRHVCKDRGLGTACRHDEDCPRDRECKGRMCKGKKLTICRDEKECKEGEVCVYGPDGMHR